MDAACAPRSDVERPELDVCFTLSVSVSLLCTVCPSSPLNLHFLCSVFYRFHTLFFPHGIRARGLRTSTTDFSLKGKPTMKNMKNRMDRGMASSLLTETLDRNNYAFWSYKMHQYLLGHGYWSYIDGANDTAPDLIKQRFPGVGTVGEQSTLLLHVVCGRTTSKLHSGCEDAEGCLGQA